MFSETMLIIIFFEISVGIITILGSVLLAAEYVKNRRIQDIYISLLLGSAAMADIGMIFSQIAYNLHFPSAYLGFKIFLYGIVLILMFVWLHLSNIYNIHSRNITLFMVALSLLISYLMFRSRADLIFRDGVIVPTGHGPSFLVGFGLMFLIVMIEAIFSVVGLSKLNAKNEKRYRISKAAGGMFFILFICLAGYIFTKVVLFYVLTWIFSFFAMLFLFIFSMIPEDSPVIDSPLNFFRTRILFKLIITLMIMIVVSLEGMGLFSLDIAKKALAESVIQGYKNIADDTVNFINKTKIDTSTENSTLIGISHILKGTEFGSRGSVFLVSPEQNVYINRAKNWISLGKLPKPAIEKVTSEKISGGDINIFGENIIAAFIPIKKLGWYIVVGQPKDYAYQHIKRMEGSLLVMILFWIAATVFLGVILARNIEDPIKELQKGVVKISEGDLGYKIKTTNIDELGQLANTMNLMTKELKQSQESLIRSERLASLGYMAAGMAHEIKNALVPLSTLTEIMQISGTDKAFIAKFNELVPKEIERINRLSSDLLHYSRPTEPLFESTDLNEVIKEASKFLEVQARKKQVSLMHSLGNVPEIKADRQKLIEVFTNLILNALEAMDGGVIMISSKLSDDNVVVEITDNGPGIPFENIKKIFVPFFTTKKEGTGMGLAIVQRIMADHGGTVEVMSNQGLGTTFFLTFPKKV